MRAILSRLGRLAPRYYLGHLAVALALGLAAGTPLAGAFFYAGREIRDWEKLGTFDAPGFFWPVLPCLALHLAVASGVLSWTW